MLEPYEGKLSRTVLRRVGASNRSYLFGERKGYDPMLIEDPAPFTVEISKGQKYSELLKNSVENYPLRDKMVFVMKDMVWVEQAVAMGALAKRPS